MQVINSMVSGLAKAQKLPRSPPKKIQLFEFRSPRAGIKMERFIQVSRWRTPSGKWRHLGLLCSPDGVCASSKGSKLLCALFCLEGLFCLLE